MGKFRNFTTTRLTSSNPSRRFDQSRLEFANKDARLKLDVNKTKILDARDILNKKKPKRIDLPHSIKLNEDTDRKEPIVIVTGLGNVRRNGDKLQVVKRNDANERGSHHVVSDGLNTFVTLTNDLARSGRPQTRSNDSIRDTSRSIGIKNFEPIRIKITNSNYNSTNTIETPKATSNLFSNSNTFSFNTISRSTSSTEAMDFESSSGANRNSLFSRTNSLSNNNNNNMFTNLVDNHSKSSTHAKNVDDFDFVRSSYNKEGFRLIVSNLHPRVTEDDVLELFSDIGPIKRARFLDKSLAEVVYVRLEHAKEAINKYDQKELDGRQMIINFADKSYSKDDLRDKFKKSSNVPIVHEPQLVSSQPVKLNNQFNTKKEFLEDENPINTASPAKPIAKDTLSNKFKVLTGNKDIGSLQLPESKKHEASNKVAVDNSIIHQVLFNKKSSIVTTPVTFTVKL